MNQVQQPKQEPVRIIAQGRIVGVIGDLFAGEHKENFKTKQKEFNAETKQPVWNWGIILAIPKSAFQADPNGQGLGKLWVEAWKEFIRRYPNNWQQLIDQRTGFPDPKNTFSMKCKDGDLAVDDQGRPYSGREGYAGHYVFTMTTQLQPQFFIPQGGQNVQVTSGIKCGDYVNVMLTLGSGDSGLYLNPRMIQLVQAGKEIVVGPSADTVFGMDMPTLNPHINPVVDPNVSANPFNGVPGMSAAPQTMPGMAPAPQAGQPYENSRVLPPAYQTPPGMAPAPQAAPVGNGMPTGVPSVAGMNHISGPQPVGPVGQNPYPSNGMPIPNAPFPTRQ